MTFHSDIEMSNVSPTHTNNQIALTTLDRDPRILSSCSDKGKMRQTEPSCALARASLSGSTYSCARALRSNLKRVHEISHLSHSLSRTRAQAGATNSGSSIAFYKKSCLRLHSLACLHAPLQLCVYSLAQAARLTDADCRARASSVLLLSFSHPHLKSLHPLHHRTAGYESLTWTGPRISEGPFPGRSGGRLGL